MTTAAEVKALVAPILARHADLFLAKRDLVLKPVRHILRGVHIGRQSDRQGLKPFWGARILATPDAARGLGLGSSWVPNAGHGFAMDEPDLIDRLTAAIEDFALPTLRPVVSIADFRSYASDGTIENRARLHELPFYKVYVDIALGDLDSAREICTRYVGKEEGWRKCGYGEEMDELAFLRPLVLAGDRKSLATLLHRWEADAVKRLKLELYWQPSPFPIEEMG